LVGRQQSGVKARRTVGFQGRRDVAHPGGGGAVDPGEHGPVEHRGKHCARRGQRHEHHRGRHKGRACRYTPAPRPSSTHQDQSTITAGLSPSLPHNVCRAGYASGQPVVPASRAAAGADPTGAQACPDRALCSGGQRCRRDHRVDDDAGRAHRRRSPLRHRDSAGTADAGSHRRPRRVGSVAPDWNGAGHGKQAVGRAIGDGALRARTAVRRQRLLRNRGSRDRRLRRRGAAGDLADVLGFRVDRAVGVALRTRAVRRTRHADGRCRC
jgi:hypothetical protein